MDRAETFNFSAGPSCLPTPVLERAASELVNFRGSGLSVMEMSHRSREYQDIFDETKAKLRAALSIPETHEILFLQGGASLQFSMVPLNLTAEGDTADYAVTGHFARVAEKEAEKYCRVHIACSSEEEKYVRVPTQQELTIDPASKYFYYCANNTIFGTAWNYVPETNGVPLVCDMSSEILSKPVDVSRYALIFAGAQKNMAPAGLTVVILDKSIAGHERAITPLMMSYQTMIDKDSMLNTPPCYNIYMLDLVLDWVREQGGVEGMARLKRERSKLVYDYLEESRLFTAIAEKESRSEMNAVFRTPSAELDAEFVKFTVEHGMRNLKGHRVAGGMRASMYNAMPVEGAVRLVELMKEFEAKHHV